MKWGVFALVCFSGLGISKAQGQLTLLPDTPKPQPGIIVGTAVDVNDDAIPGATVTLEGPVVRDSRAVVSNDNGFFEFKDLEPETAYHLTISAQGFANWTSPEIMLKPGQYVIVKGSTLQVAMAVTTVTVGYSAKEVASEQVKIEEHQRIFGFIPNFYVSYNQDAAPLTAKLKFQLAAKVIFDPITFVGVGIAAAADQAGNYPNYPQGRGSGSAMAQLIPTASPTS